MARAHLFRPVTDEHGNLLYGATVTVRKADVSAPIEQVIYTSPWDAEAVVDNPFTIPSGFVDLWLETPQRVNLLIQSAGRADISIYLDVPAPAEEVVRADFPLRVTNPAAAGTVLTGLDETSAAWQPVPPPPAGSVPVHWHPGTGANSVALGTGAVASADSTTAVGDSAAASASGATAYGQASQATNPGATALGAGSQAVADYGTAVGYLAAASDLGSVAVGAQALASGSQAVATGYLAHATGVDATALGASATAAGDGAVAVGANASATGVNTLALGRGASAQHDNAAAIGDGAATTAPDQVALGSADQTVLVAGDAAVQGNAVLGSATSQVAFFGAAPAPRQVVTGSDGGDLTLRAVLAVLGDLGLIDNQTVQG